jgi:two-component system cell cycle response regulator
MSHLSRQMQRPTQTAVHESQQVALRLVMQTYVRSLLIGFALLPACFIVYLYLFQDPTVTFEDHSFHEIAIAVSIAEGLFIAYANLAMLSVFR